MARVLLVWIKKKYMSHSKFFFLIIKTCLNSTCILHQTDLTVPLLLPFLTFNGWEKHPKIKKKKACSVIFFFYCAEYCSSPPGVENNTTWGETVLSSSCVCVSDVKWLKRETKKKKTKEKPKQAGKTTYRQITKRTKNTNQTGPKCSLLTPATQPQSVFAAARCRVHRPVFPFATSSLKGRRNIEGRRIRLGTSASSDVGSGGVWSQHISNLIVWLLQSLLL